MSVITTGISSQGPANGAAPGTWNLNGMRFDAWLYLNHNSDLTITAHPVETGADITDHSYLNAKRFSFSLGMSDVVESPSVAGSSSRSINAFNAVLDMQATREFLTLDSKYGHYKNILIQSVNASDDFRSANGSRFTINLYQPILASTDFTRISTNPQTTDLTNRGQVSPQPLNQKIIQAASGWLGGFFSGGN